VKNREDLAKACRFAFANPCDSRRKTRRQVKQNGGLTPFLFIISGPGK
jgi:hypothetical protein